MFKTWEQLFYSFGKYPESTARINESNITLEVYFFVCSHNNIAKRRKTVINVWKFYPYGANQSWVCLSCPCFTSFFILLIFVIFNIFGFPPTIFIRPNSCFPVSPPPFQRGSHALRDHCFRACFSPPTRSSVAEPPKPAVAAADRWIPPSFLSSLFGQKSWDLPLRAIFRHCWPIVVMRGLFFGGGVAVFLAAEAHPPSPEGEGTCQLPTPFLSGMQLRQLLHPTNWSPGLYLPRWRYAIP